MMNQAMANMLPAGAIPAGSFVLIDPGIAWAVLLAATALCALMVLAAGLAARRRQGVASTSLEAKRLPIQIVRASGQDAGSIPVLRSRGFAS